MRLTGASGAPRYGRGVPAHPFGGCSHAPRSIPDAVTGRWSELAGVKDGAEMHVEQRGQSRDGGTTVLKIRYYNIQPDHFSWVADHSSDGGATWVRDYWRIEAARVRTPSGK